MQDTEEDLQKLIVPSAGKTDKVREAYFEMRANMQARNAESERQRTQLVTWLRDTLQPKHATATSMVASKERGIQIIKATIEDVSKELAILDQKQAASGDMLKKADEAVTSAEASVSEGREQLKNFESQLLEKEYELRAIENEKQLKAQDVKLAQTLEELKRRCRGYLG